MWNEMKFVKIRTAHPDLWVTREKLSSMREIDLFGPQAQDSRIMRESWQVYEKREMRDDNSKVI